MLNWAEDAELIKDGIPIDSGDEWTEQVAIQQFTGVRDKTRREIYEGDIISFLGTWDEKGNVIANDKSPYKVIWFGGGFQAILIGRDGCRSSFRHNELRSVGNTDSLILGNIFENPELLTTK